MCHELMGFAVDGATYIYICSGHTHTHTLLDYAICLRHSVLFCESLVLFYCESLVLCVGPIIALSLLSHSFSVAYPCSEHTALYYMYHHALCTLGTGTLCYQCMQFCSVVCDEC